MEEECGEEALGLLRSAVFVPFTPASDLRRIQLEINVVAFRDTGLLLIQQAEAVDPLTHLWEAKVAAPVPWHDHAHVVLPIIRPPGVVELACLGARDWGILRWLGFGRLLIDRNLRRAITEASRKLAAGANPRVNREVTVPQGLLEYGVVGGCLGFVATQNSIPEMFDGERVISLHLVVACIEMLRCALERRSGTAEMDDVIVTLTLDDEIRTARQGRICEYGVLVLGLASLVDLVERNGTAAEYVLWWSGRSSS